MEPVDIMRYSEPQELRTLTTAEIALRWLPRLAKSTGTVNAFTSFNGAKHRRVAVRSSLRKPL